MPKEEISNSYIEDVLRDVGKSEEMAKELIHEKDKDIQDKATQVLERLSDRLKKGEAKMIYSRSGKEVYNYISNFVRHNLVNYLIKGERDSVKDFEQYLMHIKTWLDRKDYEEG